MTINPQDLHIQLNDSTRLVPVDVSMATETFSLIDRNRDMLSEWLPWVPHVTHEHDSASNLAEAVQKLEKGVGIELSIIADEKIVGRIGVHDIDWGNKKTSIGYWLGQEGQGKGVMTLATKAVLSYLFNTLGLHRVEIRCATNNHKSRAIPERLGLVHETTMKEAELVGGKFLDVELYSILSTEW